MSTKTRLSTVSRQALLDLAARRIQTSAETAAFRAAHAHAASLIRTELAAKYPPADMRVLKKYDMACVDLCVRITGPQGGRVELFQFPQDAPPPLVPGTQYGCSIRQVSEAAWNAAQQVQLAAKQELDARNTILADYKALINAAKTLEEIAAVWPEAEELRERICGSRTALSMVTPELAARIAADVARRVVA